MERIWKRAKSFGVFHSLAGECRWDRCGLFEALAFILINWTLSGG